MKLAIAALVLGSAAAFSPSTFGTRQSTALFNGGHIGSGGMADTRNPDALNHEDPRKSISAAPSFEEYLKSRGGAPAAAAPAAPAAAAPAAPAAVPSAAAPGSDGFQYGIYDGQKWDHDAKKAVYDQWDPTAPRSTLNFNPFETFGGNSPDASGIYPGEQRYKDPKRGDVSYAIMMAEKADIEAMNANPKAGDAPGAPGRKN
mmetsp:Transcript_3623/g.5261  ORF Transcript_3623/g.5261 Transcript_3623/m.5261 type:complete len:202 (+) Transcript_3623:64-669(+)